jgi:hypothetical protein
VLAEGESADDAIEVAVRTLDAVLDGRSPTLIKMDAEGFESEVLADAVRAAVCGRAGLESLIRVAESMVRRPSLVSVFLFLG